MASISSNEMPTKGGSKKQARLLDTFDPRNTKDIHNLSPHPVTGRLIDSHPGTRTRPMRILCLGEPRTGTMSLFTALKILGYRPYHMAEALGSSPKTSLALWCEALKAKFHGVGKPWGREEFDKILGEYDCVLDVPNICFAEELVVAYPEAKVVLTVRDVESWLRSMDNTGGHILRWNWSLVAPWDPSLAGPFWEHAQIVMPVAIGTMTDFSSPASPARQAFAAHYALVRRIVPKERLLELKAMEGWLPLCRFLNVEIPDEQYPKINDVKEFIYAHKLMWWLAFGKMVTKISLMAAVPAIGVATAMWWRGYR